MVFKGKEKRSCTRFKIPGATLSYKKPGLFSTSPNYEDEYCPILDLSLGGLRFLTQKNLKVNSKLSMKVSYNDNEDSFYLSGKVQWTISNPGFSYKYQVGVLLNPYGEKEGLNSPEEYAKIKTLEWKYARKDKE
ncbi:PilZ domain-containing protein [Acidobacteriota bacterium]